MRFQRSSFGWANHPLRAASEVSSLPGTASISPASISPASISTAHSGHLLSVGFCIALVVCASASASASASIEDPVLAGVETMLAGELSEAVIRQWLEASSERPGLPTAAEMVVLRQAGASDDLLAFLIELAGKAAEEEPPAPDSGASPSQGVETPSPEGAPSTRASNRRPPVRPTQSKDVALDEPAETEISLSYSPYFLEGEKVWDLYVYLDGKPLSYVPEKEVFGGQPLRFTSLLAPGEHHLRLLQERHVETRSGDREHASRSADLDIVFTLEPSIPAEIEIAFTQSILSSKNPVEYRIAQGGRVHGTGQEVGGQPDRWTLVCEDLELSLAGKPPSRGQVRRYEGCVAWQELWPEGAPPRSEVVEALGRFDYRPIPANEKLH